MQSDLHIEAGQFFANTDATLLSLAADTSNQHVGSGVDRSTLPMLRSASMSMVIASGKPANELQCTVALEKNIVGSGVLTLPAGISQLSDRGSSSDDVLSLSLVLLVVFGFLNGLGFLLIGEACAATNEGSYVGAWRSSVGKGTAWVPALCSLCLTFLATVGCATVIGDVGTDLVAGFTGATFDDLNRNSVLAGFATTCLLPFRLLLCSRRSAVHPC